MKVKNKKLRSWRLCSQELVLTNKFAVLKESVDKINSVALKKRLMKKVITYKNIFNKQEFIYYNYIKA